ncbi:MAG: hypothetical protein JWN48_3327 [Myxococcaceae bacterium]|nr:hypothetical protein [Myxococcaceae bacterium]
MMVSVIFARALQVEVQRRGINPKSLLERAGIEPERLLDLRQMLSPVESALLARTALELTDDPGLGLTMGAHAPLHMLQLFGHLLLVQPTLREAYAVLQRYAGLVADGFVWDLVESDGNATLQCAGPDIGDTTRLAIEFALAIAKRVGEHFAPPGASLQAARFRHASPPYWPRYWDVFHCPVEFDQTKNELSFPSHYLDVRQLHADKTVDALLRRALDQLLRERNSSFDVVQRLRSLLRYDDSLSELGSERAARQLGLNLRTMRRSLASERLSYTGLVAEARCSRACDALLRPSASIDAIALQLGFSDRTAFHRAFKRWTGRTPTQFMRARSHPAGPTRPDYTHADGRA